MRYLLSALLGLLPLAAAGQRHFTAAQLDTLAIDHPYHCHYATGKYQGYATSGEEKLQLVFLDCTRDGDSLRVSGQLLEGAPGEIFLATTTPTTCDLGKIGETDEQGAFVVTVAADAAQSLYFVCEAYHDLEIRLRALVGR